MPPLKSPAEKNWTELPVRRGQVTAYTDVLVVGGGPAGLGAALGASASGSKVILVERYGFLGGNATAALVMPLMSFHTQRPTIQHPSTSNLFPTDHGVGDSVISGAVNTFLDRLVKEGGAINPSFDTGYVVPFDPETFKIVALELLDEAGVEFLFHAFASGVIKKDNILQGVIFETKSGPVVIYAKVVVDGTGDGDIAYHSGVPYDIGREQDGLVQPMTLMFRMVEFERIAFKNYIKEHPQQWQGVHGLWDLIAKAEATGELDLPREDILFFATPHAKEVSVNSTRITKVSGVDVWDLTYAEWKSRQQMKQIVSFLKRYVPGFESSYAAQSGVQVGVRETRRIIGEYKLTVDDILNVQKFEDVIARSTYPVDIHNPKGSGTILKHLPPGESYDIPLRSLIPKEIENLLVAGRCISGTHQAHSSYRVMPVAMATGQAAGVCASISAHTKETPRTVPPLNVQKELLRQKANLGDLQKRKFVHSQP